MSAEYSAGQVKSELLALEDSLPPNEALLIGALLVHPALLARYPDLETDDFNTLRCKKTFDALRNLRARGEPITVDATLGELGEYANCLSDGDDDGARKYLESRVAQANAPLDVVQPHADRIAEALKEQASARRDVAAFAVRDAESPVPAAERWEWALPLSEYLGDDGEPDDDDAEDWIIRDLIPRGEPFLFGGAWKGGKTWTAIALVLSIATGRPFLGFENTLGRPGRVLLIALEDGRRRVRKRLWQVARGLGVRPDDPVIKEHLRISDHIIRIPGDKATIAKFVSEQKRWSPDVILIDSLTRAMTGSQNDIRDATAFTAAWREMGIEIGCASGFLHHTNKPAQQATKRGAAPPNPINTMRGSGELLAAPRNLIVMERLGADDSKVSAVTMQGNLDLRRSSFALEWQRTTDADGKVSVALVDRGDVEALRRELADARKAARQTETQKKQDRITRTALQIARDRGACSAATLAVVLSVTPRTAARYLSDLRDAKLMGEVGAEGAPIADKGREWLAESGAS